MKLLLLFAIVIVYITVAESRYPYEDTYSPGDIVPGLGGSLSYGRGNGYTRRHSREGGYSGILPKKKIGYGRHRDDALLNRDYRRRYKEHGHYLPPRGIGGGYNRHYERPDYERHRRPPISRPYYDEDEIDYGGYRKKNIGRGTRYI